MTNDQHELVIAFAATLAHRCVEAAAAGGLSQAQLDEQVQLEEGEWQVRIAYNADFKLVYLQATLLGERQEVELPEGMPPFITQLLGAEVQEEKHQIQLMVPVAWLPPREQLVPPTTKVKPKGDE